MENTNKQWKMFINADVLKETEEIVFSHKKDPSKHSSIYFNNMSLKMESTKSICNGGQNL